MSGVPGAVRPALAAMAAVAAGWAAVHAARQQARLATRLRLVAGQPDSPPPARRWRGRDLFHNERAGGRPRAERTPRKNRPAPAAARLPRPSLPAPLLAGVAGAGVGALWRGLAGGLVVGGLFAAGWPTVTRLRTSARIRRMEAALPDFWRGVAQALRAGSSFPQALAWVAAETPEPLGTVVRRIVQRLQLGLPFDTVMAEWAAALPTADMTVALVALETQREVGGALAPLLDSVVTTLEDRQRLRAEVRTLTATGRASGAVLVALPVGLALVLWLLNPAYMAPLWSTVLGHLLVGYGVLSLTIGSVVVWRLVQGPTL